MRRRHWLVMVALMAAGCSSAKKKTKRKMTAREKLHRGPQGFGDVLVSGYIDDLKKGSAEKKIAAAQQLGNMGADAKAAIPELQKLTGDKNPKVSAAAKGALTTLKKQ